MKTAALALIALAALPARAADYSLATFGTIGYAVSDQPYKYQRFISKSGTLARDSILGAQLDARFSPQWSATVQVKLAPDEVYDNQWKPTVSWAFLSWRPSDDLLLRAGRLRVPGYLHAENLDVGATYDFARLPIEMYSMSPTVDFDGASFAKTWSFDAGDLALDGYAGKRSVKARGYSHVAVPGYLDSGLQVVPGEITAQGLVLTWRHQDDVYKAGLHRGNVRRQDGQLWPTEIALTTPMPGISYYNLIPGPGVPGTDNYDTDILTLGLDMGIGAGFRLAGEAGIRRTGIDGGQDSSSGYLSLRRRMGHWTPYVYVAQARTSARMREIYQGLESASVPAWFPSAATINAAQKAGADLFNALDQRTWAIGTSYNLTSNSKIKAEWSQTRVGLVSAFVDPPPEGPVSHQSINVLSLSYSFVY